MAKKPKLSKSEKLDRDIRLAYRKQERAMDMLKKGERMLKTSASDLARLHKAKRRHEAKAEMPPPAEAPLTGDGLTMAQPGGEATAIPLSQLGETEIGKANRESWNATHPIPPKRKRKAELKRSIDEVVTDLNSKLDPTRGMEPVDREAKMKAMGFRKTSNRRKSEASKSSGS